MVEVNRNTGVAEEVTDDVAVLTDESFLHGLL